MQRGKNSVTESGRPENDGQRKLRDWQLTGWTMTDKVLGLENDRL